MKRNIHLIAVAGLLGAFWVAPGEAQDLNDLEMAHVAVTASRIDIEYAHLALAFSSDPEIRAFAETMIRDHSAVNRQVAKLAEELGVTARDNAMSQALLAQSKQIKDELAGLRGHDFDRRYAENEAAYHELVNGAVANSFLPNLENAKIRDAFQGALEIFLVHQQHAEALSRAQM